MPASAFDTLLHSLREEHRREIFTLHSELHHLKSYCGELDSGPPTWPPSEFVSEAPSQLEVKNCSAGNVVRSASAHAVLETPSSPLALGAASAQAEPGAVSSSPNVYKLNPDWKDTSLGSQPVSPTQTPSLKRSRHSMTLAGESKMLKYHVADRLASADSSPHLLQRGLSKLEKYKALRGWHHQHKHDDPPGPVARMINHQFFDSISAFAIIANTVLIGSVTSYQASTYGLSDLPFVYIMMNRLFTFWFSLELILRWIADGLFGFFWGDNAGWNIFDFIVVGTDLAETFLGMLTSFETGSSYNLTVMRMLRVLRIARALRVVRLVHFCKELRMMVLSILRSGMALIWSMVLLGIIIYIFSIFLMQAAAQQMAEKVTEIKEHGVFDGFEKDSLEAVLEYHFGSLSMSCYVLFQAVSGGISWAEIGNPLSDVHWSNALVFCFFVFFTIFAMLNIITGIFVETAINSVQNDRDEVIQEEMNSDNSLIKQLHQIFNEADQEKHGKISEDQFEKLLSSKRTYATLSAMGLRVSEARGMFSLLDSEHQGFVSIEDFLVGCMRLRGGAKSVDLITLLYENRSLMDQYARFTKFVEGEMKVMNDFEDRVDHNLSVLMHDVRKSLHQEEHAPACQEENDEAPAESAHERGAGDFSVVPTNPCVQIIDRQSL